MAQKVGTAAAVNPASTGAPPGGGVRTLSLGAEVVHNERIHTDAKGSVQLLFLDRTSMSIGPNSDVVIDEYAFDPNANTGKLAVRVGKGVMRFVGGQISHSGEATITTPSASIGIRGGTAIIDVNGINTRTINLFGHQTVTGGGTQISLYRPNFMLVINGALVPNPPVFAPAQLIAFYNAQFEAKPGQSGGTGGRVTGQVIQNLANAHHVTEPIGPSSNPVQSPTTYLQFVTTDPTWPTYFQISNVWQTTLIAAAQGEQSAAAAQSVPRGLAPGPFLMQMTNCCDPNHQTSTAPYLPANVALTGNSFVSPLMGYVNAGNGPNRATTAQTLQFGFNLTGTGASQHSSFFVATGNLTSQGPGQPGELNGMFFGTARPNSTQPISFALGGFSATDVKLNGAGTPTSFTVSQNPLAVAVTNLNSASTYTFTQTATSVSSAPGVGPIGANRPEATLTGYAGGLVQTVDPTGHLSDPYVITGTSSISLDPKTSRMQATLNVTSINPNGANPLNSAIYKFDPNTGTSAYIDYNYFGAVSNSGAGSGNTPSSTVNGNTLLSSAQAIANISPDVAEKIIAGHAGIPNGQVCQCDYTRWGLWSTDSFRSDNSGISQDLGHANLWVAGQLPKVSEVPATGTATYVGHVIAQVWNGTNSYISGGAFANVVNFGARTGVVAAGLDGNVYSGTVNFGTDPRTFSGTLSSYPRFMTLNGSFFRGVSGPVGEMGGSVAVSGVGSYVASGIFAAKMQ